MTTSESTEQSVRCDFDEFSQRLERLVRDVLMRPSTPGLAAAAQAPETVAAQAPVRCNACGRDLVSGTMVQLRAVGTIYDERGNEVHEYRDCPCGSTLLFILENRRDESEFGRKRRELFDDWLERLVQDTGRTQAALRPVLRDLFRIAMNPHGIQCPPTAAGDRTRVGAEGFGTR